MFDRLKRSWSASDAEAAAANNAANESSQVVTDDERGLIEELWDSSTLSWSTRIQGFAFCFLIGTIFSFLGSALIWAPKGLRLFAAFYTLGSLFVFRFARIDNFFYASTVLCDAGNVLSMASTCFLTGPVKQCQKMWHETRWLATLITLIFLGLTLYAAIHLHSVLLTLIFCFIQFLAMTWYSLSFIPYARNIVKSALTKCFGGLI